MAVSTSWNEKWKIENLRPTTYVFCGTLYYRKNSKSLAMACGYLYEKEKLNLAMCCRHCNTNTCEKQIKHSSKHYLSGRMDLFCICSMLLRIAPGVSFHRIGNSDIKLNNMWNIKFENFNIFWYINNEKYINPYINFIK